jgi:glycosyltransferase involved in cell wall biosynthesis
MATNQTQQKKKKSIVFFIPTFPTLSESFISRELVALVQNDNIDVNIFALEKGNASLDSVLEGKVTYIKLGGADIVLGCLMALVLPLRFYACLKIALTNKNRSLPQNLYLLLKSLGFAVKFMTAKPVHIHSHFLSEPSTIALFASILMAKEFSISAHARDVFGSSKDPELNAELVAEKSAKAEFITVCNTKAYEKCKELSGNSSKVLLRYHGVPLSQINQLANNSGLHRLGTNLGDFDRSPVIVSVGRFVEKKGFFYAIDAACQLKKAGVDFELKLVGYGPLYDGLVEQIRENCVSDCVGIVGKNKGVPVDEVLVLLSTAALVIQPSIQTEDNDAEGIPNSLLEAAALGKPIITTATGSIAEVFTHNENCLIVPQQDSKALAEAIRLLLNDTELGKRLGENAKGMVAQKFDLAKNILELEDLLLRDRKDTA